MLLQLLRITAYSLEGTYCSGLYTKAQARVVCAELVKLDEMVLQASEERSRADAVTLDPAELGAPDLVLLGNGWSIPVHRYAHMWHTANVVASP